MKIKNLYGTLSVGVAVKVFFNVKEQEMTIQNINKALIHDGRNEKIFRQNIIIVTREENSKVAFESHYGKNPNRTAENKQTNKQTKQTKAQQKNISNFQKLLRVTTAFSFETKKGKCLGHAHRALQS